MTPAQCEKIADRRERGKSYQQIGLAVGLSPGAVSWHCLRHAIEPPNPRSPPVTNVGPLVVKRGDRLVRRFTPEDDALLLALHNQGFGICTIGKRMGRRDNSVRGRLMTIARREERALLLETKSPSDLRPRSLKQVRDAAPAATPSGAASNLSERR